MLEKFMAFESPSLRGRHPRNDKTIVYLKLVKLINFPDRSSSSQACPPRV